MQESFSRSAGVMMLATIVAIVTAGSVFAQSDGQNASTDRQERMEEIKQVFDDLGIEKGTKLTEEQRTQLEQAFEERGIEFGHRFGEHDVLFGQMKDAIASGDYDAFRALVEQTGNTALLDSLTPEAFARMQEMHQHMEDGDVEGARAIAEELGLPMHPGMKHGMFGRNDEQRAALDAAVEAGDYDAWRALIEESDHADKLDVITEENFDRFAEMHRLMQAGDVEGARAIREELGLHFDGKLGSLLPIWRVEVS